jgi:hypothetical protein
MDETSLSSTIWQFWNFILTSGKLKMMMKNVASWNDLALIKYRNTKLRKHYTQHVYKHGRNLRCSCNLSFERTIEGLRTCWATPEICWATPVITPVGAGGREPSRNKTWEGLLSILERTDGEAEGFASMPPKPAMFVSPLKIRSKTGAGGLFSGVSDFLL